MFLSDGNWGVLYTIFNTESGEVYTRVSGPFSLQGFLQIINDNGCYSVFTLDGLIFFGCATVLFFDGRIPTHCSASAGRGLVGDWSEVTTFEPFGGTASTISDFSFVPLDVPVTVLTVALLRRI